MKFERFDPSLKQPVVDLFTQVFSDSEGDNEGQMIGELVARLIETTAPDQLIGFVAREEGQLTGCIFFSAVTLPVPGVAFILSPVAVSTSEQGKGIGQALIQWGIDHLKVQDVDLLFTYGDPRYYSKMGFQPISESVVKAPLRLSYPQGWLAQTLKQTEITPIEGEIRCVSALQDQRYW